MKKIWSSGAPKLRLPFTFPSLSCLDSPPAAHGGGGGARAVAVAAAAAAGVLVHEDLPAPALLAAERPVASACMQITYTASQGTGIYIRSTQTERLA